MSRARLQNQEKKQRITVVASPEQAELLTTAATDAGCSDRSTWILAHALRAAKADPNTKGTPLVIAGDISDRLRAEAERQGVTTDQIIQLALAGMQ